MNESLREIPIFLGFTDEDLENLLSGSKEKHYRKHDVIMQKGEHTDSLHVILEGRIQVYLANEDGKEIILNTQGPGEYFGELALLGNSPRTASVRAVEDTTTLTISKAVFLQFLGDPPEIAQTLIQSLVDRVGFLTENVSNLALLDVYGRVARVLLDNAREEDGLLVTDRLTQQDIANMVGSSREMISKILKDLKIGNYIRIENHRIFIQGKLPQHW